MCFERWKIVVMAGLGRASNGGEAIEWNRFVSLETNGFWRFLGKIFICRFHEWPYYLWKLKVPLEIRIFIWLLNKQVLLTKDNLIGRNWVGCKKCAFCDLEESVEHLFIVCPFAKLIWQVVYFIFNMTPPINIKTLFGKWRGLTPAMSILEGFRFMVWSGDPANSTRHREKQVLPRFGPLLGNDLRPACLTLLLGCLQWWCLQRERRLDLAEGEELSRIRALGWKVEKCLERGLGSPSQPFICEGWVSGLLSKLTTYRGGRWKP
jgi:hypothetical protein